MRCSACGQARNDYTDDMLDAAPGARVCVRCMTKAGTIAPPAGALRFGRLQDNIAALSVSGDDFGKTSSLALSTGALSDTGSPGLLSPTAKDGVTPKIGSAR